MDLNKMFRETEQQKILSEINEKSAYTKDMERYMYFGYAKGISEMLKLIKQGGELEGKELYEIVIKGFSDDDNTGSMVKRLLQD